jgi:hypothetical protein
MKTSMGRPNLEIEVQADVGVEGILRCRVGERSTEPLESQQQNAM